MGILTNQGYPIAQLGFPYSSSSFCWWQGPALLARDLGAVAKAQAAWSSLSCCCCGRGHDSLGVDAPLCLSKAHPEIDNCCGLMPAVVLPAHSLVPVAEKSNPAPAGSLALMSDRLLAVGVASAAAAPLPFLRFVEQSSKREVCC